MASAHPPHDQVEHISSIQEERFLEQWYDDADESHFWMKWRTKALLSLMRRTPFSPRNRLATLDVGGGTGVIRDYLEKTTSWTVDLTDLDIRALRRVKPGRGRILFYDILEKREEFKASYDLILLCDVLEHIDSRPSFLQALAWHLKPGGSLLINVPALPCLYSRYDEAAGHVLRFSPTQLENDLRQGGFAVQRIAYWGLTLIPLLILRKTVLSLTSQNRSPDEIIRSGFRPSPWAHAILRGLMRVETSFRVLQPFGISLIAWARKKESI